MIVHIILMIKNGAGTSTQVYPLYMQNVMDIRLFRSWNEILKAKPDVNEGVATE